MQDRYAPEEFEQKWRDRWDEAELFLTREDPDRPKFYGLDFFPYPSGAGLSVGHCRNYIPTDVLCRMKYMQGHNVLHPMGFDAFGLPAENEAIKRQRHPGPMIDEYAGTYKRQMDLIGIGYDWSRSFKSSDPEYYKWTQWIFKLLYDRGLAYRDDAEVNWCPNDRTALANEEVVGGLCERCGTPVGKKKIPQWYFKITDYADRLIDDLDDIDWPEGIKNQQRNWIGRSHGVEFELKVDLPEPMSSADFQAMTLARLPELSGAASTASERAQAARATVEAAAQESAEWAEWTDLAEALTVSSSDILKGLSRISDSAMWPDDDGASIVSVAATAKVDADHLAGLVGSWESDDPASESNKSGVLAWMESISETFLTIQRAFEAPPEPDGLVHKNNSASFRVFTTRIDTIFGMTFCVLAPEHPAVAQIKDSSGPSQQKAIEEYQIRARALSEVDRQATTREKSGVFTGAYAVNPASGKKVPIWIADYVLMGYGTGAIMAVPGHDERDYEFAQEFGIDIIPVISTDLDTTPDLPFPAKDGVLINSGEYTGQSVAAAQQNLGEWIEACEIGERKVNYKLRDWLISRQRYWGCPIPVSYDNEGHMETVPDNLLPVELPDVENYEPADDGTGPLSRIDDFVNVTLSDGSLGRRETDTMGGFACSSWYFLRFCDPHNPSQAWSPDALKYWMPVDTYIGGAEHAVMHLLYARFWTKVLYDAGLVTVKEPFQRLMNQGMLLAETPYRKPQDGETLQVGQDGIQISKTEAASLPKEKVFWRWDKMSKSKGNVVTPEEAVAQYGADALRIFELFVAPFEQTVQWSDDGMQGAVRFLHRVFKLAKQISPVFEQEWVTKIDSAEPTACSKTVRRLTHQAIKKATDDIEKFAFNTYISSMMIYANGIADQLKRTVSPSEAEVLAFSEALETFVLLLSPAAPHTADEIWDQLNGHTFTYHASWPIYQEKLAKEDEITIAVQVNGKLRDTISLSADVDPEDAKEAAQASEKVKAHTDGKTIRKVIYVPKKLVNIVAN